MKKTEKMDNSDYEIAKKRVKKIKGFYSHLTVFVAVNIFLVVLNFNNLNEGETYFQFKNFITFTFWGIGLLAHGLTVFMPNIIFGENWEQKKIQEFLDKEKNRKWK